MKLKGFVVIIIICFLLQIAVNFLFFSSPKVKESSQKVKEQANKEEPSKEKTQRTEEGEKEAIAAYVRGDYDKALVFLEKALANPDLPPQSIERLIYWLSQIQKASDKPQATKTEVNKEEAKDTDNLEKPEIRTPAMAFFYLSEKKFQSGEYRDARKGFYTFLALADDQNAKDEKNANNINEFICRARYRIAQTGLLISSNGWDNLPPGTKELLKNSNPASKK